MRPTATAMEKKLDLFTDEDELGMLRNSVARSGKSLTIIYRQNKCRHTGIPHGHGYILK